MILEHSYLSIELPATTTTFNIINSETSNTTTATTLCTTLPSINYTGKSFCKWFNHSDRHFQIYKIDVTITFDVKQIEDLGHFKGLISLKKSYLMWFIHFIDIWVSPPTSNLPRLIVNTLKTTSNCFDHAPWLQGFSFQGIQILFLFFSFFVDKHYTGDYFSTLASLLNPKLPNH